MPLGIASDVFDLLACPCPDHGKLTVDGSQLACSVCGAHYDVKDGIPVLLPRSDH
jgi:uncharacterized protein YbaR (Trm112 family)